MLCTTFVHLACFIRPKCWIVCLLYMYPFHLSIRVSLVSRVTIRRGLCLNADHFLLFLRAEPATACAGAAAEFCWCQRGGDRRWRAVQGVYVGAAKDGFWPHQGLLHLHYGQAALPQPQRPPDHRQLLTALLLPRQDARQGEAAWDSVHRKMMWVYIIGFFFFFNGLVNSN